MSNSPFPILSWLIFFPFAAGMSLFVFSNERYARKLALLAAFLELLTTVWLLHDFRSSIIDMQFVERMDWIPTLNIQYLLGVDGISVLFLPLTALLNVCVIASSWTTVHTLARLYFALLLCLESVTMGIFCALDLGLFFLFWELTLPPIYFLISLWGIGPQRRYAAIKYTLFMLTGGVPLLLGFILMALNNANETSMTLPMGLSFDYVALLETPVPLAMQSTIFILLFIGFAVKAPLFPFHVWLPTVAMQGPAGVSVVLLGLKLGLYGIIRFAVPFAPQATQQYSKVLAGFGAFCALYGALVAIKQTNLRRMLAYSSVSHVGLVLIGITAINIQGIQGAVFQLFNFGIVAGGLFLLVGFLHHRLGSTDWTALSGVARTMPLLTSMIFLLGLAAMGVPGSNGFVAENLIIVGAFKSHVGVGLAALMSAILGAAYFMNAFRCAFLGPVVRRDVKTAVDLRPRELSMALTLVLLTVGFGVFPQTFLSFNQKPLQAWVARLEGGHPATLAMVVKN